MEARERFFERGSGFTIVELLTVMSVIAILIGLLVPALNLVHDFANELQQSAQFHSIEVAVDMFVANSGYGTYPPSDDNQFDLNPPPAPLGPDPMAYGGAQKLAEALVGLDLLGYHPESAFRSDGQNLDTLGQVYRVYPQPGMATRKNIEARKGPFIELENANAFRMAEIYQNTGSFDPNPLTSSFVLCDVYKKNRISGKKTGMPILYYRARTTYFEQRSDRVLPPAGPDNIDDDIYYYRDNVNLLALGTPENGSPHILDGSDLPADWLRFEDMILNKDITTVSRPYRAGSYILISAGKDGLYGTADDMTNFKKE